MKYRYLNDAYVFEMTEQKWTKLGEDKKGDNGHWPSILEKYSLWILCTVNISGR